MDALPMLLAYGLIAILTVVISVSLYRAGNAKDKPDQP